MEGLEKLRNGKTGATDMTERQEMLRNGKIGSMTGRKEILRIGKT